MSEILKRKKIARSVPIPTNDRDVKIKLRELGRPICLFGEKAVDRRERLKKVVEEIVLKEGVVPDVFTKTKPVNRVDIEENEVFYSEGTLELKRARMEILKYSIPRSSFRIETGKKCFMELDRIQEGIDYDNFLQNNKNFEFESSQFADERGCSRGCLSPNDRYYGVAGWSGLCTIFDVPNLNKITYLKGHSDKVNCIVFHPRSLSQMPGLGPNIATCSSDNTIKLWSFDPELEFQKSTTFKGHEDRVNMVEFHPMGNYLASTSHDRTWRLWDIETKKELLVQEGHSSSVYGLSFQADGALLATADLSGIGQIWDLRCGRSILSLQGHVKQILTIKFSGNCYQVATGGDDNTVRLWDIRRKQCTYTLPAHNSTVSDLAFENSDSKFLLTCSYDSTFKIWNNRDWSVVKKFSSTSEGKLTAISLTKDNQFIITSSLDRTIKLWSLKNKMNLN
jgi:U4/U6 small nuclear ribonucleoprotein PRP4